MCARMAYEGLMEFAHYLRSVRPNDRHLQHVHFVNVDKETTDIMCLVMKSLYEKKHMFLSQSVDKPEEKARSDHGATDVIHSSGVASGADRPSAVSMLQSDHHSRQMEATDAADHRQPKVTQHPAPTSEYSEDASREMSDGRNQTTVKESDESRKQFSSESSQQNDLSRTDDDKRHSSATNGDISRDSETSSDVGASGSEKKAAVEHNRKLKKQDGMKAGGENQHSKRSMVGKDRENSLRTDDNAGATAAAAAANDEVVDGDKKEEVVTDAAGSKPEASVSKTSRTRVLKKDDCVICLEQIRESKQLDCGHKFCGNCIDAYFEKGQPKCPSCGKLFGVLRGNQPRGGSFAYKTIHELKLSGYEHYGAIEITYEFPDGIQTVCNITVYLCNF